MFVVIVGGGKVGSHLATLLHGEGHDVRVVEHRPEVFERLRQEPLVGVLTPGDGSTPGVLEAAGIRQANVLAAVTARDEANLAITTLARFEFIVPRVIARQNHFSPPLAHVSEHSGGESGI